MARRSRARQVVLQVLYQDDLNPQRNMAESDQFVQRRLRRNHELVAFAQGLIAGVRQHRQQLDELLSARASHWSLHRMAVTDRNVLRLGAYEILYTDTPGSVAIDEAVELARRFGASQSPQFVNGVLDTFLRERQQPAKET